MAANKKYSVTKYYEVWDEAAVEAGDTDDRGLDNEYTDLESLWEVAKLMRDAGATEPSASRPVLNLWYSTSNAEPDFRTGERTEYTFHPQNLEREENEELFKLMQMNDADFEQAEPIDDLEHLKELQASIDQLAEGGANQSDRVKEAMQCIGHSGGYDCDYYGEIYALYSGEYVLLTGINKIYKEVK